MKRLVFSFLTKLACTHAHTRTQGAKRMAPDGKPYLEVAEDDDIKDMLKEL